VVLNGKSESDYSPTMLYGLTTCDVEAKMSYSSPHQPVAHLPDRRFFSGFTGVSHFTYDLRLAAGADKLTANMHAMHNFTVVMSELLIA